MHKERHPIRWVIWGLAALFYFYEYFLRIEPSVMVQELMDAFYINATLVGLLNAAYFYAYAPMQLPVGLLLDRYGPRTLLTVGSLACGLGGVLFALVLQYEMALVARVLMGFGSSFAFLGMIYVCSHWFSGRLLTVLIGLGNSLGMAGAMWGEALLGFFVHLYGWRHVTIILGVTGVVIGAAIFTIFKLYSGPTSHAHDRAETLSTVWNNLKQILRHPQMWVVATVSLLMYLTTVTFAGLWGGSFVEVAYGYSVEQAGVAMSMVFLGWMVGGPITGIVGRLLDPKWVMAVASLAGCFLMVAVIYVPSLTPFALLTLLFLVGFFSSAQLLTYVYSIQNGPEQAKGTAAAFVNCMVMLAGSIAQPLVGWLLDLGSEAIRGSTTTLITASDFRFALFLFPLSFFLAFLLSFFLRGRRSLPHPS